MKFPASEGIIHLEITLIIILTLFLFVFLKNYWAIKRSFYQVEITDKEIILLGNIQNSPIQIKLPLIKTEIQIKSKSNHYYIKLTNESKEYSINRMFNWDYEILIKLFHTFKEVKNEKIIWDEKYLLEYMEKKSRSKSAFDFKMD